MRKQLLVAASVIALTVLGYVQFPGHTYLQSDTQVYVPMLERLWNPAVLQNDFMVARSHMAFTIYDEVALALRRLTGLGFREVLTIQQLLFRALGILGVFLMAASLKLTTRMALLVAAVFALGATIWGPTVLTIEYEPVPRGFALGLLLLAIGLLAQGWETAATLAASSAFLYHPTTTIPFWAIYFFLACRAPSRRRWLSLLPLAAAAGCLVLLSGLQSPLAWGRIEPWWEEMLRLRATYIWVSLWFPKWYWHYAILWGVAAAAFWRMRSQSPPALRPFLCGLPLIGILSVPASYALLEGLKSSLGPQLQPARMVLFVTAMAGVLATVAAIRAAEAARWIESFLWFLPVFAIPTGDAIQHVLGRRLLLVVLLAAGGVLAAWADSGRRRWGAAAWAVMALAPFFVYPGFARVENYPRSHDMEINDLALWARSSTPENAVFLFPDARRELYPGIFRAVALRAVYVDWKSGGQGNYFPDVAREWWARWQAVMAPRFKPGPLGRYARYGVDYVVVRNGSVYVAQRVR